MGENKNDGGPAFPSDAPYRDYQRGMSLRDWFAGHIVAAKLIQRGLHYHSSEAEIEACIRETCEKAYRLADAMLAERAKAEGRS